MKKFRIQIDFKTYLELSDLKKIIFGGNIFDKKTKSGNEKYLKE